MKTRRLVVALAVLSSGLPMPLRAADGPYRQRKEIAIGGEGGWDYLAVDAAGRRLYVSHATKVVVVDLDKDAVVGEIAPAPGVHGIALAPDLGRGFVSNGRENTVSIVDLKTLQISARSRPARTRTRSCTSPCTRRSTRSTGAASRRPCSTRRRARCARRSRCPASRSSRCSTRRPAASTTTSRTRTSSSRSTRRQRAVVATWPIAPGEEASGLALDPAAPPAVRRLQQQADAGGGRRERQGPRAVPIGPGVDANAFDPGTGLAFASSSDGTLTVARAGRRGELRSCRRWRRRPARGR